MEYNKIKDQLHEMVDRIDDPEVLYAIRDILTRKNEPDFWEELPEEVKKSIEIGLHQADNGELIPHEEMMKKYEKWLSK
jgi:predicted transcriptional regulator